MRSSGRASRVPCERGRRTIDLARRLTAEAAGTAFLLATVVGSGIMGERLATGNAAVALLANTIATGAAPIALILTFGAISGAHFNPAVTLADASQGVLPWGVAYWFTASTSFANPAVTMARAASDTSAGIRPADVLREQPGAGRDRRGLPRGPCRRPLRS